jgi:hypothetical protein
LKVDASHGSIIGHDGGRHVGLFGLARRACAGGAEVRRQPRHAGASDAGSAADRRVGRLEPGQKVTDEAEPFGSGGWEAHMTRDELADKLHHLDPGASLTVDEAALAQAFATDTLDQKAVEAIEAFSLEHRCTFLHDPMHRHPPTFDKDDVF